MSELGDCYRAAGRHAVENYGKPGLRVVHGVGKPIVGPYKGQRFAHAWVEYDGKAYDYSNGGCISTEAEIYRLLLGMFDCEEYTVQQVNANGLRTGHWGPWENRLEQDYGS
jgi:hypothetical protein